jgi:hypothetical protein
MLATAPEFPRPLGHDEKEVLAFASRFRASKSLSIPFVHFFAAPAQASGLASDGNARLAARIGPFERWFGEKPEVRLLF